MYCFGIFKNKHSNVENMGLSWFTFCCLLVKESSRIIIFYPSFRKPARSVKKKKTVNALRADMLFESFSKNNNYGRFLNK